MKWSRKRRLQRNERKSISEMTGREREREREATERPDQINFWISIKIISDTKWQQKISIILI